MDKGIVQFPIYWIFEQWLATANNMKAQKINMKMLRMRNILMLFATF